MRLDGAQLPRSLLMRILRSAAGNPLVAIELTRPVLDKAPDPTESGSLPIPTICALTAAALQLRSRGAPDAAADLLELGVLRTPEGRPHQRAERGISAAENHFHSGYRARALTLATEVISTATAGPLLGRAFRLLGMIRYHEDSFKMLSGFSNEPPSTSRTTRS